MYLGSVFIIFKVLELTVHLHFLYSFIHFPQKHKKKNRQLQFTQGHPPFFRLALNAFPDIGSVGRFEKKNLNKISRFESSGFQKEY